ncbi:MAG: carbohydrate kinase [Chitinophagaceae bacterium]|nr:carbohydrate kinase [Chitinophagaceae bacterium]
MTLIFDIGKTNKKAFVFDNNYKIIYEESHRIPEIKDEDGFPCDDLETLTEWILATLKKITSSKEFRISAVNFSSFGASFVHINELGQPLLPLYSYLKPLSPEIKNKFFSDYGGEAKISRETASPVLDSLNSGLQLYRLKYEKSIHTKPGYSLHLPQYLSYLVTRKVYSDITSIGCHTMLWNFEKDDYHDWVNKEGLLKRLAPVYPSSQLLDAESKWGQLKSGIGLHDSSSAITPYLATFREPFALISTGTWSISLNPFNHRTLTSKELEQDCLCFFSYRKKPVKASRFFAGNVHEQAEKRIAGQFNKKNNFFNQVRFDTGIVETLEKKFHQDARTEFVPGPVLFDDREMSDFNSYEEAYHQLILDIIHLQVLSTNLVLEGSGARKIFVDGGFSKNEVFMKLLARAYTDYEVYSATVAQASAIGAALVLNSSSLPDGIVQVTRH